MVLYNVPGRTVADMQHDTVLRLAQVPGIVGIKEATGNIERAHWLIKRAPKGFAIYSGDDPTAVALMLLRRPGQHQRHRQRRAARDARAVRRRRSPATRARPPRSTCKLLPLHKHLFVEPNPVPAKWAMAQLGLCGDALRLPHHAADRRRPGGGRSRRCATPACV